VPPALKTPLTAPVAGTSFTNLPYTGGNDLHGTLDKHTNNGGAQHG
jgi:hypothetical protein